eukprot:15039783-Alexandrium_andersonii.AAC.1
MPGVAASERSAAWASSSTNARKRAFLTSTDGAFLPPGRRPHSRVRFLVAKSDSQSGAASRGAIAAN